MSDVIDVLERMGQDAQWSHASQDELQLALAATEITPELQAAIVAGDQMSLEVLLGISPMCAMLSPGKDDEEEDEDNDEELPGQDGDKSEKLMSRSPLSAG